MNKERRILVLPSWYPPDGGYFFREHSEAIKNMGWPVDVLAIRLVGIRKLLQEGPSALKRFHVSDENGLRVVRSSYLKVPGSEKYNIRGWADHTLRSYRKYERKFGKPALILVHSVTWAGYAAYLIHETFHIPYVIVEHRSFFVWTSRMARRMVRPYYLPFFKRAYSRCRRLVLVSESQKKGIDALVPFVMKRVQVIPNMIRADQFRPPPEARKDDPFVFFWAGRLEHVKGIDLLLDAAKILAEKADRPFVIRLAGKGSRRRELEGQAKKLGVRDRIRFLGRLSRDEILQELQGANCFVLPSRYEAFGVALLEAMATGLPVIATASGGPDLLVTRDNGLLIDQGDPRSLAWAMGRMMATIIDYSPGLIRDSTLQVYGDAPVMKQYDRLLNQLLRE